MDINKKKLLFWNSDDQLDSSHVEKSYQCSFCDRGFSNAQALGGHMNIHRKDRAKLKRLFSEEDDQSCADINQSNAGNISSLTDTTSEEVCKLSRQHTPLRADEVLNPRVKGPDDAELLKLLPLSLETQTANENRSPAGHGDKSASSVDEWFPNLDLELRLGPEPRTSSRQ